MGINLFNSVKMTKPKSSKFDLTHDVKMSGKMGNLMPIMAMECIPGDRVNIGADSLIRFAPLIAPVMHRMDVSMHYFFVPHRLTWEDWPTFIVQQQEDSGLAVPTINITSGLTTAQKKFLDYLGLPPCPIGGTGTAVTAFQMAAYQMVYNEYYRDQNLIPEVDFHLTSGDNSANTELLVMRQRAWEHDYFTASLPWAQKGNSVDIPLGDVVLKDDWNHGGETPIFRNPNGTITNGSPISQSWPAGIDVAGDSPTAYDPDGTLQTSPTTINELRRAFKLQEWLEKNARGGTRYIESILAHFGVKSSDKRLQRPEYITGIKSPVIVSEVLNTTGESGGLPQGNMAGHAVSVAGGKMGSYFCEEHGTIIGVLSVMPKTAYQQGIPKTFLKYDPLDYFWPSFAHIGEQPVQNQELYAYTPTKEDTFGYVPRYAEYKYMPSRVAGDFRTSLDYWHLGRIFNGAPALNQNFIECIPDNVSRIFAVEDGEDNLYMHILNKVTAIREMPKFGTPGF